MPTMLPGQARAARALLGLSEAGLAKAAGVSVPLIQRAEGGGAAADVMARIQAALERAGISFLSDEGDGPGLRLRKRRGSRQSIPVEELNAENDE